jgi:hypothetical protein
MGDDIIKNLLTYEYLYHSYHELDKSIKSIAQEQKVNEKTVRKYLIFHNILSKKTLITKELLEDYYHCQKLNPYQISQILKVNHKTIRKYLKNYKISLRSKEEYNFLGRQTYQIPDEDLLNSSLSLILHSLYICEGWHTDKACSINFCNQDPLLIKTFCIGLQKIYCYSSIINLNIRYDFSDSQSQLICEQYEELLNSLVNVKISYSDRKDCKNPIIYVNAGGKNLIKLFINNMNYLVQ